MADQKVYFMQHGLAVDKADDPERPLSKAGIVQTEKIADTLRASGTVITSVFHSGKLRAAQTAEIISNILVTPDVSRADGLSPNDDVTLLAQDLKVNNVLYIGHLPHLEKLVTHLVASNAKKDTIKFKNSAVVCLTKQENNYFIDWYLTPDTLITD